VEKIIIPSIIAKSQEELDERISKVKDYASLIQLDVMDGEFVQNTSLDFDFNLPQGIKFEAHLMVSDPAAWLAKNIDKVDTVLVHAESCVDPASSLRLAKEKGKKVGIALDPKTGLERLEPFLDTIDQALILTVKPGFYGSRFVPEALDKVRELRRTRPGLDIEVDGGIDPTTIIEAAHAGANMFVSGSFIIKAKDPKKAFEELNNTLEKEVDPDGSQGHD